MTRSLFLRLFVGLWGVVALLAIALVASSPYFTRSRPALEQWQVGIERLLERRVEEVASAIAAGRRWGPGHPRRWPHAGAQHQPLVPVYVLDRGASADGGAERWLGVVPDEEVAEFSRRVPPGGELRAERTGVHHLAGRVATAPDGRQLVVVAAVRRPPGVVDLLSLRALTGRLLLLTLLVALPAWWIARRMAAPVAALRAAVRRLADGDLTARLPASATRRRDELGDLARDFNAMAPRLEALVGAQQQLVRDVSHELRSPLARLRVALELARQRADSAAAPDLDRIELEAERLDELVDGILTLSRLETAAAPRRSETVDCAALVEEVVADARFESERREPGVEISVEVHPEGGSPALVVGDREELRRAIDNVLRNAVRYAPPGSRVEVHLSAGSQVEIRVCDRGPGVPREMLQSIFEPFVRVEGARERGRGGAGLGLAIAARAVRRHRGTIAAAPRSDGGLEVCLSLPAAPG